MSLPDTSSDLAFRVLRWSHHRWEPPYVSWGDVRDGLSVAVFHCVDVCGNPVRTECGNVYVVAKIYRPIFFVRDVFSSVGAEVAVCKSVRTNRLS